MGNTQGKPYLQDGIINPEQNSRYSPKTEQILRAVSERQANSKRKTTKLGRKANEDYKSIVNPDETVDGGYLFPHGVYKGKQDYNVTAVRSAIIRRQIAPFYKGLDFVNPGVDDELLLETLDLPGKLSASGNPNSEVEEDHEIIAEKISNPQSDLPKPPTKEQIIWLYKNVLECPICFLEYPRLNDTRCCHQQICTECFVNIRRLPAHPSHSSSADACDVLDLVSEPANCPYCAQSNFGVTFEAPPFEWGIPSMISDAERTCQSVVSTDMVRPDWEEKLQKARRKLAKKTAHARALHRSALLPTEASAPSRMEPSPEPRSARSASAASLENASMADASHDSTDTDTAPEPSPKSRSGSLGFLGFTCGSWKTKGDDDIFDILKESNTFPDMMRATNDLTPAQLSSVEARMIEQATAASLNPS